ncbi:MAG: hypothetical protein HF982_04650 [Desulfobacteraceae bacterium]|nr:hypothetical protein [Desulfobacteraceae bacterium]MBC2718872.1 hypothetical protein [Desulfobacteraceae bacterium]
MISQILAISNLLNLQGVPPYVGSLKGKPCFKENLEEIKKREHRFGKSLVFSNMLEAETGYLIDTYNEKNIIENNFHLLKDVTLIRFRPIRHWTDSKIRAFAFCCVVSMILIRVMQWMTGYQRKAGHSINSIS